jgi:PAS domain S-box-containing protein
MPGRGQLTEIADAQRLQLLIDAVVDYAIYMLDLEGRVVSWNSGGIRLKGYSANEIIGQRFDRFYTDEDRAAGIPEHALKTARETGRFHAEGWRVRKDGTRFWASVVIDPILSESGDLLGYAKVTRDITERQMAQQSLLESERQYRQLVEAVVDYAIFQLDAKGYVTTWNAGAQRIKQYAAREIIGKHFSNFYTEGDREAGVPQRALETADREGRYEAEGWRVRKDGSRFMASVVIDPIRDDSGAIIGYAKVTRDVTERYKHQQDMRAAQEQLAASQKMEAVGQLSGGIAHDFNNLLMIVIGNLETAQRHAQKLENPNLTRAVGNAVRGAQRAAALTSRLLAFSRRQALDPKPIDVNKFLNSAADFIQRSLGEQIEIETVGAPGLWQVEADPNHLESALVNLAINARDSMPNGGKLTLESANVYADEEYHRRTLELPVGQYVCISVTDTGTGMSPDVVHRAFEPFFTTKDLGQGTGLGLSQVYGFIKQSGGHVKIYSEVGQGTTVKIYLPRLVGKASASDEIAEPSELVGSDESETILVVEDDADLRSYITEVLQGLGYRVLAVADAEAAMRCVQNLKQRLDLLLTDIIMPKINGRELAHEVKATRPDLPVLFMTGYSRNAVVHQGRLDEGVDLLQKPVSQAELASRVRIALDRKAGH